MSVRDLHNRRVSFFFLIALTLHLPVFAYVGSQFSKDLGLPLALSAVLIAVPWLLYATRILPNALPSILGFVCLSFSGLLIHLAGGMIEMHFHIFVILASLTAFGLLMPVVAGVLTAAVHHLLFFFVLPASVFNYKASLAIVLLHATFVVLEAIPVLYIASQFRKMILMQDSTISQLGRVGETLDTSVTSLAEFGSQLSEQTQQTSEVLKENGTSLRLINDVVHNNAGKSQEASKVSKTSNEVVAECETSVKGLISIMNEIQGSSAKISDIISVIDDIAFQTNLLALNAAVEAARAGEQGKGFAVVAEAVRALSQKSAEAAKDISHLVNETVDKVQKGSVAARSSEQVLKSIIEYSEKVSRLNGDIAATSSKQSDELTQVSSRVLNLEKIADSTFQSSQQISDVTDDVSEQLSLLNGLILELQGKANTFKKSA